MRRLVTTDDCKESGFSVKFSTRLLTRCLTSQLDRSRQVILGHDLSVLNPQPAIGRSILCDRKLHGVQDDPVRTVADAVYVLQETWALVKIDSHRGKYD